jgi:hypothetical protein
LDYLKGCFVCGDTGKLELDRECMFRLVRCVCVSDKVDQS